MLNRIKYFNKVIVRCPRYPLNFFYENIYNNSDIINIFAKPGFQEAIYIASNELYQEALRSIRNSSNGKISKSLYKYIVRSSTRCTPFGLFAGIGTISVDNREANQNLANISIEKISKRVTRLDMNFLCLLAHHLSQQKEVKGNIKYFPNNSIYCVGDKLRYIDYRYTNQSLRTHQISNIDNSQYLQKIFSKASNGATIPELIKLLIDEEYSIEESSFFIEELINEQILISELEPQVTNSNYLLLIYNTLKEIKGAERYTHLIKRLLNLLKKLDSNEKNENWEEQYNRIIETISNFNLNINKKYIFQTDMLLNLNKSYVSESVPKQLITAVNALVKLSSNKMHTNIDLFAKTFFERYESREVPLVVALDPDLGIGFPVNRNNSGDETPLLDNIFFNNKNESKSITLEANEQFLQKKLIDAIRLNNYSILLSDIELSELPSKVAPFNSTFNAMVEIINNKQDNNGSMVLKSVGGNSALCLIGRFCHMDKKINGLANEITKKEKELNFNKVIAEIIHMPDSRTGNILMHPAFFDFEIPYLANSSLPRDKTIGINDLMLSVKNGKLVIRSKRINAEVLPRLSNAHNYSNKSLPIYRFLCEMQSYNRLAGLSFSWGALFGMYDFFPQVKYRNIILHEATWIVKKSDIIHFYKICDENLVQIIKEWRYKLKLPSYVKLTEGDNEIAFDLNSIISIKLLLDCVRTKNFFVLKEFLQRPSKGIVSDEDGNIYANQLVFSFYIE